MKRILIIGAGMLLSTSVVFAQGDDASSVPPPAGAPDPNAAPPAAATGGGWTTEIGTRPLVLDKGMLEIHGSLPIVEVSSPGVMGMAGTSATAEVLSVGGSYGAADKLEVGADYAFLLHPNGTAKGTLGLRGAYAVYKVGKLEVAVGASLAFNLNGVDAMGNSTTDLFLQLGGWARYQLAPKISLFTGQPALPFTLGGFSSFLVPPEAYQLQIGLNNSQPVTLTIPVGVGLQATPNVYAFLATEFATFGFSNSNNAFIFSDYIPLAVGAFYSPSNKLDVGVTFADDLKNASDFYVITVSARAYLK